MPTNTLEARIEYLEKLIRAHLGVQFGRATSQIPHPQSDLTNYLKIADIDDTPVNGVVNAPISSNWAYDVAQLDFLVGTASGLLGGEIAVGTTPGGELGNTWASPTVDASHSGSTHAATQAAAEATASSALTAHAGAADPHTGYLKESTTIDFLVGTATADLAGEIVVGATPGGELGNTWASPTVATTHSGSSHAGVVSTHEAASDPHTGYRLESADHSHASTGLQAGQLGDSAFAAGALTKASIANRSRTIWLPAQVFTASGEGTPDLAVRGAGAGAYERMTMWAFDGSTEESILTVFYMPADWAAGSITLAHIFAPSTADGGNVMLQMLNTPLTGANLIDATLVTNDVQTTAVGSTAKALGSVATAAFTPTQSFNRLTIRRTGSQANDTYNAHDLWYAGALITYTADM